MEGIIVMAKPKDIVESTNPNNQQQSCLEELKKSPLFYLSAGSKELFHSDFLYWLATQHWDVFICVMRDLADLADGRQFWWENTYSLENGNLEIRRESQHFDLVVYVFIDKKRLPVLVLENKVKTLPNVEQLISYTQKAEKEWVSKGETREKKEKLTSILLSLIEAKRLLKNSGLKKIWSFKKYDDLLESLESKPNKLTGFHKQLFSDYCSFIRALCGLAESWTVNPSVLYLARMCPEALPARDKKIFEKEYKKYLDLCDVRLDDVWQKVSFDNLRILVENKLSTEGIYPKHFRKNKSGEMIGFYLDTGYSNRGHKGYIELRYVLESHTFKNEPVCVIIQLEGNHYRYAVTGYNIVTNKIEITPNRDSLKDKIDKATEKSIEDWITSQSM